MSVVVVRELASVRHLFAGEHAGFVLAAMIAGNSPARAWVDDLESPRVALIWDGAHNVYLAGSLDRPELWRVVFDIEIASTGPGMVKVHTSDPAAGNVLAGIEVQRRERVLYRMDGLAIPPRWQLPDGMRVSAINESFAELVPLANFDAVVAEIESCWHSLADFRRRGFGFVAHDADAIVCWCTAEYVSERQCGIGIETVPEFQGQGLATLAAAAFVRRCVDSGVTAHWDAWTSNLPSIAVADKLGFQVVETYSVLVADLNA
ncbi:GNAT family N-acetyltransferase [Tenggerimyces flavus]|uniref:GNAT family N-acetyltransferase n=1 Tax=Tenggerimyces flavus TaxID=1708749 RepID=A0ABV7YMC0_9ACTN|nr:GNAT family N-acetyltransferase [Tenggerimyces flavus]MBM7789714.1 RimJ/RimL family protein N-acetyltransferase [Tenggerimyces flavus]